MSNQSEVTVSTESNTDRDSTLTVPDSATIVTDTGTEYTVAEIEHSNRIYKSATPKHTVDWYVKWFSSVIVLCAITIRAAGIPELQIWDMFLSWVGAVGWWIVGFMWRDRALILLNGAISVLLFSGLLKYAYEHNLF
jgi:hypothetical protein